MQETDVQALVGQRGTIEGTAYDAHLGAVVVLDDHTPVYVAGLERWDRAYYGRPVRVEGRIDHRAIAPVATVSASGEVSHGLSGPVYVVDDARWSLRDG